MKQIYVFLAFAGGIYTPLLFKSLPTVFGVLSCFSLGLILFELARLVCSRLHIRLPDIPNRLLLCCFFFGLIYGVTDSRFFQASILPQGLNNIELRLDGRVSGIPEKTSSAWNKEIWKFDFIPHAIGRVDESADERVDESAGNQTGFYGSGEIEDIKHYLPQKVRLAFYGTDSANDSVDEFAIQTGQELGLYVKLRRPHGLNNPGLFNYQRWLIAEGYSATGYVKRIITIAPSPTNHQVCNSFVCRINQTRADIAHKITASAVPYAGIQSALLVGDSKDVSSDLSSLFIDTGTIHLMVISGLHIGFIAALGFFIGRWILVFLLYKKVVNTIRWASLVAILCAFLYSAIAGFSMPTVRALIMVTAFMLPRVFFIKTHHWWGLSLALCTVGLVEPRAPLQSGFWLSFGAVVLIFLSIRSKDNANIEQKLDKDLEQNKRAPRLFVAFWSLIKIQLVFLTGFAPVILLFQGQINLVSFIANLIAVPLTSLVIVPLEFIGLAGYQVSPDIGLFFWHIAGYFIGIEIWFLEFLRDDLSIWLTRSLIPEWMAILSVLAGFGLIGLRSYKLKFLAFILILPLVVSVNSISANFISAPYLLEMRVFDVGQGTAVLIRQPDYSLLYDTGAKFSETFDSGADILAPSLRTLGIQELDDLVLSHPDSDHVGGFPGLYKTVGASRIWFGRKPVHNIIEPSLPMQSAQECLKNKSWNQNGVEYRFIHPAQSELDFTEALFEGSETHSLNRISDNDRSCVLSIQFGDSEQKQQILLMGDISSSVEANLLDDLDKSTVTSVLLAPHHGSKSSSSHIFINHVSPLRVVFSAGYLSRFGHPHPEVVQRYKDVKSTLYGTYIDGMVRFIWTDLNQEPVVKTEAERHLFWWQK